MSTAACSDTPEIGQSDPTPCVGDNPRIQANVPSLVFEVPTGILPRLMREVAEKYGTTVADIKSKSRFDCHVLPRHEYFWMARQIKKPDGSYRFSSSQVGKACGGRDHSTVLSGAKQHNKRRRVWASVFGPAVDN